MKIEPHRSEDDGLSACKAHAVIPVIIEGAVVVGDDSVLLKPAMWAGDDPCLGRGHDHLLSRQTGAAARSGRRSHASLCGSHWPLPAASSWKAATLRPERMP